MGNKKEKTITFRVEIGLYNFLKEFSISNKTIMSEMVRNILVYFMMGYLMGIFNKTMPEMKKDFLRFVDKGKKS